MSVDWQQIRTEFPALSHSVWLNTATFGHVPLRAQEAIRRHYDERNQYGGRWFLRWFQEADDTRADIAQLFGVQPEDVAYLPNANQGLSLLVNGIDWQVGDEYLHFENEFPNQPYACSLAERRGAIRRCVPLSAWREGITARTRLVVFSQTNYSTGEDAPMEEMVAELRGRGVLIYADGTQTAGARKVKFASGMPDMYAVNCYKWLNAPPGAAFMLVPAQTRKWLQPQSLGWRSHWDWRNVNSLHLGSPVFSDDADRYEGGMLPFENIFALRESVRLLHEMGMEVVEDRVLTLAERIRAVLTAECAEIVSGNSHIVAARLPEPWQAPQVASQLEALGVDVSARHGLLRVSAHYYNNEQDIERFGAALQEMLHHA